MWKITEIHAENDLIVWAKYHVAMQDGDFSADSEGYWHFANPTIKTPFDQVTEEMVADWIKDESKGQIEQRLADQIEALKAHKKVVPPWMPQVFTPSV